ncbi:MULTISPECIES: hypothetical protein [unclassified Enterococcus]|uniref:hypothetical protein n=1 Tax=unclassified Enterococcus TaxID=2608891 RepID=UPI001553986E|nr:MULTISPECIES: hypothetical protein [unclassified Enterococcus]MBS7576728.1 hypothetical protein [Enterococcus sp. MMGLQ5-2]MBS7583785.1 hypothetical protein [Enterococcus sp. MMGLQ5-1]NPD11646.1 hypothetical protein [Enterococcus sp. MMGLQ5-1]NPD36565.1 hypothetical protein [Enterococcus sp. MMGLQ5-2]
MKKAIKLFIGLLILVSVGLLFYFKIYNGSQIVYAQVTEEPKIGRDETFNSYIYELSAYLPNDSEAKVIEISESRFKDEDNHQQPYQVGDYLKIEWNNFRKIQMSTQIISRNEIPQNIVKKMK